MYKFNDGKHHQYTLDQLNGYLMMKNGVELYSNNDNNDNNNYKDKYDEKDVLQEVIDGDVPKVNYFLSIFLSFKTGEITCTCHHLS